jgi:hypothetical protein
MNNEMNAELAPSANLYEHLSTSRNSLRRENIKNVKAVCDQMQKDKIPITPAEVAKRCVKLFGGPAASTITNTNSPLGEYIRLRKLEQKDEGRGENRERVPLSGTVNDPILAAEVQLLEEKNRMLKLENHAMRNLFKKITGFDIDKELKRVRGGNDTTAIGIPFSAGTKSDDELQAVLLKLMDHLFGDRQYESYRGRFAINRKMILTPPEYELYRKATGLSEEEWIKRYGEL